MIETSTINFEVTCNTPPMSVCITGNHETLGNWQPEGLPLRHRNGVWQSSLDVPKGTWLEFKVTDGTWEKEAAIANSLEKENLRLFADEDKHVQLHINDWLQNPQPMQDNILGHVDYLGHFSGDGIRDREVIVWLPTQYFAKPKQKFPVLYMHDGQNLVDPNTAFLNSDWGMDETVERLAAERRITPPIIVGLYNTSDRLEEYNDTQLGRDYLKFIVEKIKPLIDERYRTYKSKQHTAVMGSSMGGLISFLATWYYPNVFGKAACLSPMFWGKRHVKVNAWKMVEDNKSSSFDSKIYLDNGTVALERALMPGCLNMVRVLEAKGYQQGDNLEWFKDEGALHDENAWAQRVWRPLEFMFGK
ncbi:MAG: hypothetical protein GJ680_00615 [Alteromonadaceae bacterium]|nr:hypothetical protein [Alteromonadaceae bacterium]